MIFLRPHGILRFASFFCCDLEASIGTHAGTLVRNIFEKIKLWVSGNCFDKKSPVSQKNLVSQK